MAILSPVLASADTLLYDQTTDNSGTNHVGLGPNPGNNPKYSIVGTFTPTSDFNFYGSSTTIDFTAQNSQAGVSFDVWLATSTDDIHTPTDMPTFLQWNNIDYGSDGVVRQHSTQIGPNVCTPTGCIVHAGETVYVAIFSTQGISFSSQFVTTDVTGDNFYGQIYSGNTPVPDTSTHIVTVTPTDNATIATSTTATVGARIYVNTTEWVQALAANNGKWFVQMTITPSSVVTGIPSAAGAFDAAFGTTVLTFPITTNGSTNFSTTTPLVDKGSYNVVTQIIQPPPYGNFFAWFGIGSARVLATKSTRFTVSEKTGFDTLQGSTTSIIDDFFASTSPQLISSCASFTGFNLGDCLNLLFIPQSSDLGRVMNTLNTGVFAYAPFGYVTRMVEILSGQSTSTFPMLSTSFPDPSHPSELMTYTFDQNEALAGAGALLDNLTIPQDPSVNVRGAMDLIVKTIIALSVMSYIFYDLAHSTKGNHKIQTKLS